MPVWLSESNAGVSKVAKVRELRCGPRHNRVRKKCTRCRNGLDQAGVQDTAMKVRAARLAIALLATGLAIGVSGATVHADEGWIITSFHSDITIAGDSTLTIKEDIRVDFGSL